MELNNHDCDCYIGNMGYSPLFMSSFVEELKFRIKSAKEFEKARVILGYKKSEITFSFKELVEDIDTFIYCPYCGKEIDLEYINNSISKIKVPKKYS